MGIRSQLLALATIANKFRSFTNELNVHQLKFFVCVSHVFFAQVAITAKSLTVICIYRHNYLQSFDHPTTELLWVWVIIALWVLISE